MSILLAYFRISCRFPPHRAPGRKNFERPDVRDWIRQYRCDKHRKGAGEKWAVAVAVFDMLKGGIAVLLASFFTESSTILALTGVFSVLGHNYPVRLGWRGGKGVATTFGVFAFFDFFDPLPALIGGAVWYAVLRTTKYVCVASIAALFAAALLMPPWHAAAILSALSGGAFDLAPQGKHKETHRRH